MNSPIIESGRKLDEDRTKKSININVLNKLLFGPPPQWLIHEAEKRGTEPFEVVFNQPVHPTKDSSIEKLIGKSGWLRVSKIIIQTIDIENQFLFAAIDDNGDSIFLNNLLNIAGTVADKQQLDLATDKQLILQIDRLKKVYLTTTLFRHTEDFESGMAKLNAMSDSMKCGLEQEIKDLGKMIKAVKREVSQIQELKCRRKEKRQALSDAMDEIDRKKEALIGEIEALKQSVQIEDLVTIRWRVV